MIISRPDKTNFQIILFHFGLCFTVPVSISSRTHESEKITIATIHAANDQWCALSNHLGKNCY